MRNNKIQLKDKSYIPILCSGLGRVYLRKHLVDVPHVCQVATCDYDTSNDGVGDLPHMHGHNAFKLNTYDDEHAGYAIEFSGEDETFYFIVGTPDGGGGYNYDVEAAQSGTLADVAALLKQSHDDYVVLVWLDNKSAAGTTLTVTDGSVDQKNILTQAMLNKTNTIYHIQYDYDLNGESITVPEGCVLQFDGGSLSNGTIVGQATEIAGIPKITATTSGTWSGIFTDIKDIDNRLKASGSTRPTEGLYAGYQFFDTALGRPIYWNGTKWVEEDGATAGVRRSGSWVEAPAAADIYIGFKYFATDLYRNIYWDGTRWADDGGFTAGYHKGTIPPTYEELNGFLDLGYCYYVMNGTTHTVTPIYAADFDDAEQTVKWVTADGNVWQPNE